MNIPAPAPPATEQAPDPDRLVGVPEPMRVHSALVIVMETLPFGLTWPVAWPPVPAETAPGVGSLHPLSDAVPEALQVPPKLPPAEPNEVSGGLT